jgi:multimeric flavodoxin WrbA
MPRLLIVRHSPTESLTAVADAVAEGAGMEGLEDVEVVQRPALEAGVEDVRGADGVLLVTPCNFGYMSGALKHFFDSTYNDLLDVTAGLPYALVVKGTTDASGAVRAVEAITTGLKWKRLRPPTVQEGDVDEGFLDACRETGAVVAAELLPG